MREAGGVRRGSVVLLVLAALTSACADTSDEPNETPGIAGSAAASGVIGQPPAGAGGSPGMVPPPSAPAGSGALPPGSNSTGGVGGTGSSLDAGAQAGSTAPADAAVDAGAAGMSGSGSAPDSADAGSMTGDAGVMSVCMGGTVGMDSDSAPAPPLNVSREFAGMKYLARTPNQILSLKTTLKVPKTPTTKQTLFIWPGLQSRDGAADPARIGNGVLQPVLTWGASCAPSRPADGYAAWWISGMYVNVTSGAAGPSGCAGGDHLVTELGDLVDIEMSVKGTVWTQTMTDRRTMETVDFPIDLKGQIQNNAMWIIEVPSGETIRPSEDTVFIESVLTFSAPVKSCQPSQAGGADHFSAPILSPDGLHCCYDEIILSAQR